MPTNQPARVEKDPNTVRLSGLQQLISKHGLLWTLASVIVATIAFLPFRPLLGSEQWGWPYLLVVGMIA